MSISNAEKIESKKKIDGLVTKVIANSVIAGSMSGKTEQEKEKIASKAAGAIVELKTEIDSLFNKI
ncbi:MULTISPECIES: hypothetical protein [Halomonadaceae]|uniref:hypothetical protein n=1 Tax=Halomonadaceae TaxID=28256 RepID=UPI001C634779|nr:MULTISPECIES: hypothetical protein [Halomonas]BCB59938.1 hypothetical protein HaloA020_06390 [Halomonas sp. A020]